MRWLCCHMALLFAVHVHGQLDSAAVSLAENLATDRDEWITCEGPEALWMIRAGAPLRLLTDMPGTYAPQFDLFLLDDGAVEPITDFTSLQDDGTAYYHLADSTLWFSSAARHGGAKGNRLKLYSCKRKQDGWGPIEPFLHNDVRYHQCHPWLDSEGEHLFFSTDRAGGRGGMDLWYCVKFATGWSQPIWAGNAINTAGHELFPTLQGNRLFFSSTGQPGAQGLDLYTADGDRHWQAVKPLPSPINSPADDFQLVCTSPLGGWMASNRGEAGGDNPYQVRFLPSIRLDHGYTAVLQCKGTPLQNERVDIYNADGELLQTEVTAASGELDISALNIGTPYTARADQLDDLVLAHTLLYIKNREGTIVQIIPLNGDKFQFELLPYDSLDLPLIENPDNSILAIDLGGQVYHEVPGDVGRGHPVYILSKEGELLSLAYTQTAGQFSVDDLRPLSEYTIQVDPESKASQVAISNGAESVVIALTGGSGDFRRLQDQDAISILDEFNQPIQVRPDEVFILKNIYYSFDKTELNPVARAQLKDLAAILRNNPILGIELSSHTDARGTAEYNTRLSEQRAQTAIAFLVTQGISQGRLQGVGYGESRLINHCADGIACTELEHALNRRTELRMVFE